jgi:peroxiredoxin Q/BCP
MAQLRQDYQKFVANDAEIIVIGPEGRKSFARYWDRERLPFVGVPDPDHRIANFYRQQVKLLKLGRLPALVVVDKEGAIQYRHYGESMRDIPDNSEILSVLSKLNDRKE